MKSDKFSFKARLRSLTFAVNGLKTLIKEEHNFRIHMVAASCAVLSGILLKITLIEWLIITLVIGIVLILEIINTSIEGIANLISPGFNPQIKKIKDIAAAGVLISSIIAVVIGLLVFIPKFTTLILSIII